MAMLLVIVQKVLMSDSGDTSAVPCVSRHQKRAMQTSAHSTTWLTHDFSSLACTYPTFFIGFADSVDVAHTRWPQYSPPSTMSFSSKP